MSDPDNYRPAGLAGMTLSQATQYMLLGDRRHGAAADDECGAVDPRYAGETKWCRRPRDGRCQQRGAHNSYRDPDEWADG